ncbi:hypothetical protein B0H14DRAFT_3509580 [Mycena olivaceomarginata]|nr:hypothetical protein B0H14DRAFT_3509580 [Mycena olivaceomarginata]
MCISYYPSFSLDAFIASCVQSHTTTKLTLTTNFEPWHPQHPYRDPTCPSTRHSTSRLEKTAWRPRHPRGHHSHDAQLRTRAPGWQDPSNDTGRGPRLVAYYGYTEDEWSRMVDDQEYCQHVVHPVPARLMDVILKRRKEIAAKKKVDEEKAKEKRSMLQGSMKMSGVIEINPLTRPPVTPAFAEGEPQENPDEEVPRSLRGKSTPRHEAQGHWGSDDHVNGRSVLTWTNAMENFIEA